MYLEWAKRLSKALLEYYKASYQEQLSIAKQGLLTEEEIAKKQVKTSFASLSNATTSTTTATKTTTTTTTVTTDEGQIEPNVDEDEQ